MVFVTHDLGEAALLSDRVVIMSRKPGRVGEIRDVGIPRPRTIREVRFSSAFAQLERDLWDALERQSDCEEGSTQSRRAEQS